MMSEAQNRLAVLEKLIPEVRKEISVMEENIHTWVGVVLQSYSTTAQMNAAIELSESAMSASITSSKDSLGTVLSTLQGKVDSLETVITDLVSRMNDVETRLGIAEGKISAAEGEIAAIISRIQSITVVPTYTDGSVRVASNTSSTIRFEVNPVSAAKALVDSVGSTNFFKFQAVNAETKASSFIDFPVTSDDGGYTESFLVTSEVSPRPITFSNDFSKISTPLSDYKLLGFYSSDIVNDCCISCTYQEYLNSTVKTYWQKDVDESGYLNTMSFFATNNDGGFENIEFNIPTTFPSFSAEITDPVNQKDIIVAESIRIGYFNPVPLVFNHALTRINLSITGAQLTNKMRYTISNVTLGKWGEKKQIAAKGVYSFGSGTNFSPSTGYSWNVDYSTKVGYDIPISSACSSGFVVEANTTPENSNSIGLIADGPYLMMPQISKSILVSITYKAEQYNSDTSSWTTIFNGTQYVDLVASTLFNLFQCGKRSEFYGSPAIFRVRLSKDFA